MFWLFRNNKTVMWLFVNNHPCFGYIKITTLNNKSTFGAPYYIDKQRTWDRLTRKKLYYSSKIFPRFWLVKTTRTIHDNQLLLTNFGKIKNFIILSRWRQNDVKSAAWLQVIKPLTEKTWGRGSGVLVVETKWRNCRGIFYSFHGEILSKNIARTTRRQLDGRDLLFGVYLQTWADLIS